MKSAIFSLVLILAASTAFAGDLLPLTKDWQIQSSAKVPEDGAAISSAGFAGTDWHTATVPSTVLAALVETGELPDPYYGENLRKIPGYQEGWWFVMENDSPFYPSWWYRTAFNIPADFSGKHLRLHFDGINYRANIWLNGEQIANGEDVIGMFRRFDFDVTDRIRVGETNYVAVEITAPGHLPEQPYRTKQVEATTGWDDHNPIPPDLNMGIWQDVYLSATGPVVLRHSFVQSDLDLPSLAEADLTITTQLTNVSGAPVTALVRAKVQDIADPIEQPVQLAPGETREIALLPTEHAALRIENPRVWWPHPLGPQELYELDLTVEAGGVTSDSETLRFGIREATTTIEDGWRAYWINGRRILIRGGAWMTADMLLRLSERRYEALVRYAREANLNMLRSEGFSIRETKTFYDLCDEYGIMVTQQIFGRSIPDEDLAIACIDDMILRIRNHPSLVHFIGHDETYPTENLDKAYRDMIAKYCPKVTYQPNSGDTNETRFKSGGTRTGWRKIWTYADPIFYYEDIVPGSAYDAWGFAQSGGIGGIVVPYESLRRFIPKEDQWPLWSPSMALHTINSRSGKNAEFFDTVVERLNERYGAPKAIEEFCTKAQALNYDSARGMFEAWGREKYRAKGITTWKYNAAWPAVMTWHYVDWNLMVGGAYYGAKKACEPLHVQYSYDDHTVYVVNTLSEGFEGLRVAATVYDFDIEKVAEESATVSVTPDGKTQALALEWPEDLSTCFFLKLDMFDPSGECISDNFYWLSTVPDVLGDIRESWVDFRISMKSSADFTALNNLKPVTLEAGAKQAADGGELLITVTLSNPTDRLAFLVQLALHAGPGGDEAAPAYWDDNYFSLLPEETKKTTCRVAASELGGAKPVVVLDGWNVARRELP